MVPLYIYIHTYIYIYKEVPLYLYIYKEVPVTQRRMIGEYKEILNIIINRSETSTRKLRIGYTPRGEQWPY